ncbi:Mechanosensitive ion channel family protein [Rubrivivax sp. A210]|nr:Mechanosensitive ion channel family protein [Rubrivivax sp. A210]
MALAGLLGLLAAASAVAQEPFVAPPPAVLQPEARAGTPDAIDANTVYLNQRRIVTFRARLLGDSAAERAAMARAALADAVESGCGGAVTRSAAGAAVRFDCDGLPLFFLVADDVSGPRPEALLDVAAQRVEGRLKTALQEAREIRDTRRLAWGAAYAALASAIAYALIRLLLWLRRQALARLDRRLERWHREQTVGAVIKTYADSAQSGARITAAVLTWGLALLLLQVWATFVLRQFAYTRPWGERSAVWLLDLLKQFALAAADAIPGLLTAALIFFIARLAVRATSLFMLRVERGELQVSWLDIDTAGPTRRIAMLLIWLFALAMAYPYLPGAGTEAFKGVTVLAGLMLSLGASGVVGQAMSGLTLMYSRSLRVGEYVRIGEAEGTVAVVGLFATKLRTGMGEEVSLPSAAIVGQSVRNYSRLAPAGQVLLQASVTIGYATAWRQVHAMLLEAARRTDGVAAQPAPYVVQTALSDFYVEYRLCAQGSAALRRSELMSRLHANVQDVFNENGVQIMSPHYVEDPAPAQVVPREAWSPALVQSPAGPDGLPRSAAGAAAPPPPPRPLEPPNPC